jgi:hypothetical protein
VAALHPGAPAAPPPRFDVRALLERRWMQPAMDQWIAEAPVTLRLTPAQAELLQQDWYYRHARFHPGPDGSVSFTFGEDNQAAVFALLRWLGPSAELLEPAAWRARFVNELQAMARVYQADAAALSGPNRHG